MELGRAEAAGPTPMVSPKEEAAELRILNPISQLVDRVKRVIVTPAVYPRLSEFLHRDIQSTGQKSLRVNARKGNREALF